MKIDGQRGPFVGYRIQISVPGSQNAVTNKKNRTGNIETIMVTTSTTVIIVTTAFDVHHVAPHARSPALAARSPSGHASLALPLRVTTHRHARLQRRQPTLP